MLTSNRTEKAEIDIVQKVYMPPFASGESPREDAHIPENVRSFSQEGAKCKGISSKDKDQAKKKNTSPKDCTRKQHMDDYPMPRNFTKKSGTKYSHYDIRCNLIPDEKSHSNLKSGAKHLADEVKNELVYVNVCDVCGDSGWDHLLVTCSRCVDGAEHTYCMPRKMDQVPEGDWLCEGCRDADANEAKTEILLPSLPDVSAQVKQVSQKLIDVIKGPSWNGDHHLSDGGERQILYRRNDLEDPKSPRGCPEPVASSISGSNTSFVLPEDAPFWHGTLDVSSTGMLSDTFRGIQAHMSTNASSEARRVAACFPGHLQLEEVPFPAEMPSGDDDSIALYFFPKGCGRYQRSYQKLLRTMASRESALKGSIDGHELLFFPSTTLPEEAQRWNGFLFIWGTVVARSGEKKPELCGSSESEVLETTPESVIAGRIVSNSSSPDRWLELATCTEGQGLKGTVSLPDLNFPPPCQSPELHPRQHHGDFTDLELALCSRPLDAMTTDALDLSLSLFSPSHRRNPPCSGSSSGSVTGL